MNDYQLAGKKTNDMSCVLRVDTATSSLLLTGDITVANEKALIVRSPRQLASQVLIVPHHGGKGSSSPEFVEAVAAGDVIFSAGYLNAYQHPRPEVLQRYEASKQWRTDHGGAIHVVLGNTTTLTAWRQTNP
jgi:competence protein ComEC